MQNTTRDLWPGLVAKYKTYISAIVYEEARSLAGWINAGGGYLRIIHGMLFVLL